MKGKSRGILPGVLKHLRGKKRRKGLKKVQGRDSANDFTHISEIICEILPGVKVVPPAVVRSEVSRWDDDRREAYEERAAIIEYEGGETRDVAEQLAFHFYKKEQRIAYAYDEDTYRCAYKPKRGIGENINDGEPGGSVGRVRKKSSGG